LVKFYKVIIIRITAYIFYRQFDANLMQVYSGSVVRPVVYRASFLSIQKRGRSMKMLQKFSPYIGKMDRSALVDYVQLTIWVCSAVYWLYNLFG